VEYTFLKTVRKLPASDEKVDLACESSLSVFSLLHYEMKKEEFVRLHHRYYAGTVIILRTSRSHKPCQTGFLRFLEAYPNEELENEKRGYGGGKKSCAGGAIICKPLLLGGCI